MQNSINQLLTIATGGTGVAVNQLINQLDDHKLNMILSILVTAVTIIRLIFPKKDKNEEI